MKIQMNVPPPLPLRSADLAAARQALEANRPQEAIALLQGKLAQDTSGQGQALLGAAHFRLQNYAEAARCYAAALSRQPENAEWQQLHQQAVNNRESDLRYDPGQNTDRFQVMQQGAQPGAGLTQSGRITPPPPQGILQRAVHTVDVLGRGIRGLAGHALGAVIGGTVGLAARWLGQEAEGEIWTTWSRRNQVKGLLMLANMRRELMENNLHKVYPEGELVGFAPKGMPAPEWTRWARTADGSWNNWDDPLEGAANTRFGRNIKPENSLVDEANLLTPNPREISRVLMTRDEFKPVPFLNMLAASWIQFQNHDWISHGDNKSNEFFEIPLSPDDPVRQKLHMTHMFVPKTEGDPTRREGDIAAPTHLNEVTHWWDGSQIYGSDLSTQLSLRSMKDGKMKLNEDGTLPLDAKGVEMTGFRRNWWTGLSLLHTLFVHEHNAICDMLKSRYPDMNDETLFQKARLINAAVMAKIHTVEWTPAVLPNPKLNSAMHSNWFGAATKALRDPEHRKTVADFPLSDEISGGLVGGELMKYGVPEARTEEFTSVYRLHPLLPDELQLKKIGDDGEGVSVPLAQTRQAASKKITDSLPLADLLYSFGNQHPGQLVLNNYPETLQELAVPGFAFMDLAAVDILRDRERGVPRYNEFRRQFGLQPIRQFEDLTDNPEQVAKLKQVYEGDVEKLDLLVGTLAEGHRPENFGFGETLFQVFILNASRRLMDDRFYTTSYNAETYTPEGLEWIDQANMKGVLLRHYPELAETGLANVENAFEPWDEGRLDPARHPLRQYSA